MTASQSQEESATSVEIRHDSFLQTGGFVVTFKAITGETNPDKHRRQNFASLGRSSKDGQDGDLLMKVHKYLCTYCGGEERFLWLTDTQSAYYKVRQRNVGACGECSEKSPWLGKRLKIEIKNRKLWGNLKKID